MGEEEKKTKKMLDGSSSSAYEFGANQIRFKPLHLQHTKNGQSTKINPTTTITIFFLESRSMVHNS